MLKTEKRLQRAATNPGWQFNSHLCSYIVARFVSLLTVFRCKSLHCINCVATRNLAAGCVEISVFGRTRCIAPKYGRSLGGGAEVEVVRWWCGVLEVVRRWRWCGGGAEMVRSLGGGAESWRWCGGPTPVVHWSRACGTNEPNKFIFHIKFSATSWNYILLIFLYMDSRERWLWFMLNFGALLAKLCDLWPKT